ncbi:MAG: M23 family metallopeptidase [Chloroflexi bacterium]|nr:M23 family metallopeptidase [Chloroflexota bacterium]
MAEPLPLGRPPGKRALWLALAGLALLLCCGAYFAAGLRRRTPTADCFIPPVETYAVTQSFLTRDPASADQHLGEDIPQAGGAPVVSAAEGYAAFAGEVAGYGALVVLEHRLADGQALLSIYGNLALGSLEVRQGQMVGRGERLGRVAEQPEEPGLQGPHLHLGVRQGAFERRWNIYGWGPETIAGAYLRPSEVLQRYACPGQP